MPSPNKSLLRVGEWCVNPAAGQISRNGETIRLEERAMRLLVCLADHAGELMSIEDLLQQVWPDVTVTPDSVYQAVASLRRQLGDDSRQPVYIATAPRLGYRMVASVSPWQESGNANSVGQGKSLAPRRWAIWAAAGLLVVLACWFLWRSNFYGKPASAVDSNVSLAVLPFVDLTEGMREEEFADGLTEEITDKMSKLPGFHVSAPTAAFYYKNKQVPLAEIGRALGVVYAVDGSTRQSGTSVRIAVRLMRAENGTVIWSETYDRPFNDRVRVQDDVAGEISRKLQASLDLTNRNLAGRQ